MNVLIRALDPAYARLDPTHIEGMFPSLKTYIGENQRGSHSLTLGFVEILGVMERDQALVYEQRIKRFAEDDQIGTIFVFVNSPGGSSAGINDLSEAVFRAAKRKRVVAYIDSVGASGAYYSVAGASEIVSGVTSAVGSVGCYIVVADYSRFYADAGIDVYVVQSGALKATGVHGSKITSEQLEYVQSIVNSYNRHFLRAVARGRRMDARRISDFSGKIFIGQEAVAAGLVDRVAYFDDLLQEELSALSRKRGQYSDLQGVAALEQFLVLANRGRAEDDEFLDLDDVDASTMARLKKEFPALTAAATSFETARPTCRPRFR